MTTQCCGTCKYYKKAFDNPNDPWYNDTDHICSYEMPDLPFWAVVSTEDEENFVQNYYGRRCTVYERAS